MTKEAQRAELHKAIWRIANDLRGSVDGWDFKQYVLGMLFYRFISENLAAYLNEHERKAGSPDFDYAAIDDEAVRVRGIFSRPGYGRVPIAADYYNGLNHDSHLQAQVVTVHSGQITGRIGEAAYDYDPFEDFLDL
jgi:hypothetical protein